MVQYIEVMRALCLERCWSKQQYCPLQTLSSWRWLISCLPSAETNQLNTEQWTKKMASASCCRWSRCWWNPATTAQRAFFPTRDSGNKTILLFPVNDSKGLNGDDGLHWSLLGYSKDDGFSKMRRHSSASSPNLPDTSQRVARKTHVT